MRRPALTDTPVPPQLRNGAGFQYVVVVRFCMFPLSVSVVTVVVL
jgi:hypothetical protein